MASESLIYNVSFNALFLMLFCIVHSLMARDFVKKRMSGLIKNELIRFVYVLISVVTILLVLYLWKPVSGIVWQTQGGLHWVLLLVSYACLIGGFYSIYVIDYLEFFGIRSLWPGVKNPTPKSSTLSTKGPYAYCRHPMYLFFGLAGLISPVMTYTRLEFLSIAIIYVAIAIPFEEKSLRAEIGEAYDIYRANVPAVIPRFKPWRYEH